MAHFGTRCMAAVTSLLLILILVPARAQERSLLPIKPGVALVTCASGFDEDGNPALDNYVFGLIDIRRPPAGLVGRDWQPTMYHHPSWTARNLGEVFGAAFDDQGNFYLAATSTYHIDNVGPAGPGGIYKINGVNGEISTFASLPNSGPGIGNICFDPENRQFFASNLEDGKIYRLNLSGRILSTFDPGAPDDDRIGFAPLGERVWGIGFYENRVWYGVWKAGPLEGGKPNGVRNELRSVNLDATGSFLPGTDRKVFDVEPIGRDKEGKRYDAIYPISDIAFSPDGDILIAERGAVDTGHAYSVDARVLRYPYAPLKFGDPDVFNIGLYSGFLDFSANSAGGVDYGYDFASGNNPYESVWATSYNLWVDETHHYIQGISGMPVEGNRLENVSNTSYFITIRDLTKESMGDIEIFRGSCPYFVELGENRRICSGESVTLSPTANAEPESWEWLPEEGLSCDDCKEPVATPSTTTTYTVRASYANGCTATDRITITVDAVTPEITADGSLRVCNGDSVTLSVGEFDSYEWTGGGQSREIVVKRSGRYIVTVTSADGCTGSDTVDVAILAPPDVTIESDGPPTICAGGTVRLSGKADREGTFRWSTEESGPDIVVSKAGTYRVSFEDEFGCVGYDSIEVEEAASIKARIRGEGGLTFCEGRSLRLTAGPSGREYRWSTGETSESIVVDKAGTYILELTDAGDCPAEPDTVRVEELPLPVVTLTAPDPPALCPGGTIVLRAESEEGSEYLWSNGETSQQIVVGAPGIFSVEVTAPNGCVVTSDVIAVTELDGPIADAGPDVSTCVYKSVRLSGSGGASYEWSPADGLSCVTCPDPIAQPARTTTYTLTVTDKSGCSATDQVTVTVDDQPRVVQASIPRDRKAIPGTAVIVPMRLDPAVGDDLPDEVVVEVAYEKSVMLLDGILQPGTLSDGATVTMKERRNGSAKFRITGLIPGANDVLVNLRFITWIGDRTTSEIPFSITADSTACLAFDTSPGLISLDSICGLEFRLIELTDVEKNAISSAPDPASGSTTITFTVALDGYVEVELFDAGGRSIGRPVAEHLDPGSYDLQWNVTDYPAGVYYARMTAGGWTGTKKIVVAE